MAHILREIRKVHGVELRRTIGGAPFRTLDDAAGYAEALIATYPGCGFNAFAGRWWAQDGGGSRPEFTIVTEDGDELRIAPSRISRKHDPTTTRSLDRLFPRATRRRRSIGRLERLAALATAVREFLRVRAGLGHLRHSSFTVFRPEFGLTPSPVRTKASRS